MWVRNKVAGSSTGARNRGFLAAGLLITGMLSAVLLGGLPEARAGFAATMSPNQPQSAMDSAAVAAAQKENKRCLLCHSRPRFKTLEDGERLSLEVAKQDYSHSAHGGLSCVSCHTDIAKRKHPIKKIAIASQRAFSLEMNDTCRNCHAGKFTQYKTSIHASLVAQGDKRAPVCTDCHGAHNIEPMSVYQPVTGMPCKKCHADIYKEYSGSVHGLARKNGNVIRAAHIQAPICADCHTAHKVTAPASNGHLTSACTGCHDNVAQKHDKWLPNAGLHLEVVDCAACHAPVSERRVDLELTSAAGTEQKDAGPLQRRLLAIEKEGGSLGASELWKLVRESKKSGKSTQVVLRGRLEVSSGAQAHHLASRLSAVRDCSSCHHAGSSAFQNVVVSIRQPDGRDRHYRADRDTLDSAESVDSVGDFYALGGTRIRLLDKLLVAALMGGLAIPIGHFTVGRIIKKHRDKGEQ